MRNGIKYQINEKHNKMTLSLSVLSLIRLLNVLNIGSLCLVTFIIFVITEQHAALVFHKFVCQG